MKILYATPERYRLSKKARKKQEELLQSQRTIKRSLGTWKPLSSSEPVYHRSSSLENVKSAGIQVGSVTKQDDMRYTGDKIIGVSLMHKSNLVPVFNQSDAEDIAHMRR